MRRETRSCGHRRTRAAILLGSPNRFSQSITQQDLLVGITVAAEPPAVVWGNISNGRFLQDLVSWSRIGLSLSCTRRQGMTSRKGRGPARNTQKLGVHMGPMEGPVELVLCILWSQSLALSRLLHTDLYTG